MSMVKEFQGTFGDFLFMKRKEQDLKIKEVAQKLKISPTYYGFFEADQRKAPDQEMLDRIAQILELTQEERILLYDLAGMSSGLVATDLSEYIMRPFFLSLPKSLDEAARIDGCNAFTSFTRIMIPIARVGLVTCMVFCFLHGWNDLIYSMTFNVKTAMRPLTANIYKFMDKYGTKWNQIMAYGTILVIPVLIVFVGLQKYIIGGLTSGAVKE